MIHFENKCINCDLCIKNCSNKSIIRENNKICVVQDKCIDEQNEIVTDICPTGALTMDSKNYTLDEVIEIALKDKAFFKYGVG